MTATIEQGQVTGGRPVAVGIAVADLVFLGGIVVPHLTGSDPLSSPWLGLPALVSVFALPLIAYVAALGSARRLLRPAAVRRGTDRRIDVTVVALAVTGFVAYVSPWGLAAITGFMIALD